MTYREFRDSREGFPEYEPTSEDWAEYEDYLDQEEEDAAMEDMLAEDYEDVLDRLLDRRRFSRIG